jgi:thioesterase domain-containing protein
MKVNSSHSADSRLRLNFARAASKLRYNPIIRVSERSGDDLLILLSGGGGNLIIFSELVKHLSDFSILGLTPKGWNGKEHPFLTIEETVDTFYSELKQEIRGRRVHFIGWCFGGILGLELASKFCDDNQEVCSVSIIESMGPFLTVVRSGKKENWILMQIREARRQGVKEFTRSKLKARLRTMRHDLRRSVCKLFLIIRKPIPFEWREKFIQFHDIEMERSYKGTEISFDGRVSLFWSMEDPEWDWLKAASKGRAFNGAKAMTNWSRCISGPIEYVEVPGNHISMFQSPNVADLAAKLLEKIHNSSR